VKLGRKKNGETIHLIREWEARRIELEQTTAELKTEDWVIMAHVTDCAVRHEKKATARIVAADVVSSGTSFTNTVNVFRLTVRGICIGVHLSCREGMRTKKTSKFDSTQILGIGSIVTLIMVFGGL